jgi:hypothetical protein
MPSIEQQWFVIIFHINPYPLENGQYSTHFKLVHHVKPDLRLLFQPFSLAAVYRERIGDETLSKFSSQVFL